MDRDYNSSVNIENEGLMQLGMVCTEFTPVEIESSTLTSLEYLNRILYVKASSVVEAGSLTALAGGSSLRKTSTALQVKT